MKYIYIIYCLGMGISLFSAQKDTITTQNNKIIREPKTLLVFSIEKVLGSLREIGSKKSVKDLLPYECKNKITIAALTRLKYTDLDAIQRYLSDESNPLYLLIAKEKSRYDTDYELHQYRFNQEKYPYLEEFLKNSQESHFNVVLNTNYCQVPTEVAVFRSNYVYIIDWIYKKIVDRASAHSGKTISGLAFYSEQAKRILFIGYTDGCIQILRSDSNEEIEFNSCANVGMSAKNIIYYNRKTINDTDKFAVQFKKKDSSEESMYLCQANNSTKWFSETELIKLPLSGTANYIHFNERGNLEILTMENQLFYTHESSLTI